MISVLDTNGLSALPSNVFDAVLCDELCLSCAWRAESTVSKLFGQLHRVLKEGGVVTGLYPSGRAVLSMDGNPTAPLTVERSWINQPEPFGARWTPAGVSPAEYLVFDSVFRKVVERTGFQCVSLETGNQTPVAGPSCVTLFGLMKPYTRSV